MFRLTALRLAPLRSARPLAVRASVRQQPARFRRYATEQGGSAGGGGGNQMYIVLAAILGIAGAGYWYLKPVRDVAATANSAVEQAKSAGQGAGENIGALAKSFLPPGAFAIYSTLSSQPGGINGFLSNLKDKDLQGVLDEVKKHGGDEVKRVIEKVEAKVKEANGKVQNVDWVALAQELKKELPQSQQHMVDVLIGKLPDKGDIDSLIKKAKEMGQDQLKQVEDAAAKILQQVDKAKKDGKNQADAFLKGLKEAAPADVDSLVKQLKDAAKKAGLPADTAEAWLKSKAEDQKVNAEETANQVIDKLRTGAKMLPVEPKELVKQVEQLSPSLAKLLAQALQQAGITDEKGNKK